MSCESEADLSDEEFQQIAIFAQSPPPAVPTASEDDVRECIAFLASTLKAPRNGADTNRVKLGAYRLALAGIPKPALTHAVQVAIRTMEWLPAPAELLKIAEAYCGPEKLAHSRARRIYRDRCQRLFEERCKAIRSRTFPVEQFGTLTESEIRHGLSNRALLRELDGTVIPWTLEDENRIITERQVQWGIEGPPSPPTDERDKRASKAPDGAKSSGSVGDLAAGLMAGMEVSDGE